MKLFFFKESLQLWNSHTGLFIYIFIYLFYKNTVYENIEANISKIFRICEECLRGKYIFFQNIISHVEDLVFECEVTCWFCWLNNEIILSKVG